MSKFFKVFCCLLLAITTAAIDYEMIQTHSMSIFTVSMAIIIQAIIFFNFLFYDYERNIYIKKLLSENRKKNEKISDLNKKLKQTEQQKDELAILKDYLEYLHKRNSSVRTDPDIIKYLIAAKRAEKNLQEYLHKDQNGNNNSEK